METKMFVMYGKADAGKTSTVLAIKEKITVSEKLEIVENPRAKTETYSYALDYSKKVAYIFISAGDEETHINVKLSEIYAKIELLVKNGKIKKVVIICAARSTDINVSKNKVTKAVDVFVQTHKCKIEKYLIERKDPSAADDKKKAVKKDIVDAVVKDVMQYVVG